MNRKVDQVVDLLSSLTAESDRDDHGYLTDSHIPRTSKSSKMPYHVLTRKQLQKERSGSQPANRSFQSPSSESQPRTQRSPILVGSKLSTGRFTRNGEEDELSLSVSDEDLDFMNEAEVPEEAVPTGDQTKTLIERNSNAFQMKT